MTTLSTYHQPIINPASPYHHPITNSFSLSPNWHHLDPSNPTAAAHRRSRLQVRLLQVEAREPQDLADQANKADERRVADLAGSQNLVPQGAAGRPGG